MPPSQVCARPDLLKPLDPLSTSPQPARIEKHSTPEVEQAVEYFALQVVETVNQSSKLCSVKLPNGARRPVEDEPVFALNPSELPRQQTVPAFVRSRTTTRHFHRDAKYRHAIAVDNEVQHFVKDHESTKVGKLGSGLKVKDTLRRCAIS